MALIYVYIVVKHSKDFEQLLAHDATENCSKCIMCKKKCSNEVEFYKHTKDEHIENGSYTCMRLFKWLSITILNRFRGTKCETGSGV